MNDAYVFIPALGLASGVGLILGLIYFDWYERHQRQWQIRLQETVQADRRNPRTTQTDEGRQTASTVYPRLNPPAPVIVRAVVSPRFAKMLRPQLIQHQ